MAATLPPPFTWDRIFMPIEKVKERCRRFSAAMEAAGVPYCIIGGNAVAAWVTSVDPEAERFTKDVDVLLRRSDMAAATAAAEKAGFVHATVSAGEIHMFLDGPDGSPKSAVHVIFAGERVTPRDAVPAPDVAESDPAPEFRVVSLEALVRMKLTSHRLKDQVHVQDMIRVGLLDATWPKRLPDVLAQRLQAILDNPEG